MRIICCLESIFESTAVISNWALSLCGVEVYGVWSIEDATHFAISTGADLLLLGGSKVASSSRTAAAHLNLTSARTEVLFLDDEKSSLVRSSVLQSLDRILNTAKHSFEGLLSGVGDRASEPTIKPISECGKTPDRARENSIVEVASSLPLSVRQKEVMLLLLRGWSNKKIAGALNISVNTTKAHVAQVLRVVGAPSRAEIFYHLQRLDAIRSCTLFAK